MRDPKGNLRLAFVTAYDASDPAGWSGVALHMARALEAAGIELEYVGSLRERRPALAAAKRRMYRLAGRRYMHDRDPATLRAYAEQVAHRLAGRPVDAVLSPGTLPVAYLECALPLVVWTDATFGSLVGFYPEYSRLCRETLRGGEDAERAALHRCALAIYTSEWAAAGAVEQYGADPARVRVVPFGANLADAPDEAGVAAAVRARSTGECRLLFLGRDWERKGGPTALAVTDALTRRGVPARLAIVGCAPRLGARAATYCEVVGPIDAGSAAGRARLAGELRAAHFLILPTRADCTPHAVAEANAFGVPCLATAVGGLPTIVREGVNGTLFAAGAAPAEWSEVVARTTGDRKGYESLALSSYAEYRTRLNWHAAAEAVRSLVEGAIR
ncbi:MAG TPA: glycosyltransferase family 4 protein [Thermoanaerobaculaceae bacterium]|nr:glycosyltransferase family 4 protein [Thermoanaerobaculaceae bacterium]